MGTKTNISWTDATWNIATGCTKVDEDCKFCYMYRDSRAGTRYDPMLVKKTKTVFTLPLKLKEPHKIFASSLTDFFHEGCDAFRDEAWEIIRKSPQHTFQILTKRPERITQCLPNDWGEGYPNVWLGVSVGSNKGIPRIIELSKIPALVRFVSFEPLYELLDLTDAIPALSKFHWAIIGGESGFETGKYRYRECKIEWIEILANVLRNANVAVFIKQMGTHLAKERNMSDKHGGNIDEFPEHLQIREFPNEQN